jgi:transcriptional regulator with AAA-type ATPase domain
MPISNSVVIVFSELENVLSTEQCRYNVPTKNRNLPTTIQQAAAMSNNDDMEIDIDSFRGPRGTKEKRVQQKARGNKSEHRGSEENEREQHQREYILKLQQETARNDSNDGEWTQVGDRVQGLRGTR